MVVKYNEVTVGYLTELEGQIGFQYDEDNGGYKLLPFYDITQTRDEFEHE